MIKYSISTFIVRTLLILAIVGFCQACGENENNSNQKQDDPKVESNTIAKATTASKTQSDSIKNILSIVNKQEKALAVVNDSIIKINSNVQNQQNKGNFWKYISIFESILLILVLIYIRFLYRTLVKSENEIDNVINGLKKEINNLEPQLSISNSQAHIKSASQTTSNLQYNDASIRSLVKRVDELEKYIKNLSPFSSSPKDSGSNNNTNFSKVDYYVGEVKGEGYFNDTQTVSSEKSLFHIFNLKDDEAYFEVIGIQSLSGHYNSQKVVDMLGIDIAQATNIKNQIPGKVKRINENDWVVIKNAKVTLE